MSQTRNAADTARSRGTFAKLIDLLWGSRNNGVTVANAFERDSGGRFAGVTDDPATAAQDEQDQVEAILNPKKGGKKAVANTWSDEAREAAAEARRLGAEAHAATKGADGKAGHRDAGLKHAAAASSYMKLSAKMPAGRDRDFADSMAKSHMAAADAHGRMGALAKNANFGYAARKDRAETLSQQAEQTGTADDHNAAAKAHRAAASEAADPKATGGEKDYSAAGYHANKAAAHENSAKMAGTANAVRRSGPTPGVSTGSVALSGGGGDSAAMPAVPDMSSGGAMDAGLPSLASSDTANIPVGPVGSYAGSGLASNEASADVKVLKPGKAPKEKKPKKGTRSTGGADLNPPAPSGTATPTTTTNAAKCPECGGEMVSKGDTAECMDCDYTGPMRTPVTYLPVRPMRGDQYAALTTPTVMPGLSGNARKCPECGGDMDADGECEDCDYVMNQAAAPVASDHVNNTNPEGTMPQLTKEQREAAVKQMDRNTLIANVAKSCRCTPAEFQAVSDGALRSLLLNALAEGSNSDEVGKGTKARANTDDAGDEDEDGDFGDMETPAPKKDITGNAEREAEQKFLASMPPRFRAMWNGVVNTDRQQRQQLAARLTQVANASPEPRKGMILNRLKAQPSLTELQELLVLVGNAAAPQALDPDALPPLYVGAAAPVDGFTANADGDTGDEPLGILTMNDLAREERTAKVG